MTDDSRSKRPGFGPRAYGILFKMPRDVTLSAGVLGERTYSASWYVYVGSAMSGVLRRLKHHLRAHERLRWHLDYLLPHGKVSAVVAVETRCRIECYLATALARRFRVIDRFGSSDCHCEAGRRPDMSQWPVWLLP